MLTMPNGEIRKTETDDFGDFFFYRIDEGTYDIAVKAEGFKSIERKGIELSESLNLGDFPLERV